MALCIAAPPATPSKPTQPCILDIPPPTSVPLSYVTLRRARTTRTSPSNTSLYFLRNTTGEPSYLETAQEFLSSLLLSSTYFDSSATDGWQAILRDSAAAWGDEAVGSVTADYFLLESMVSGSVSHV